jgi:hypothetical protein
MVFKPNPSQRSRSGLKLQYEPTKLSSYFSDGD